MAGSLTIGHFHFENLLGNTHMERSDGSQTKESELLTMQFEPELLYTLPLG